MKKLCAILFEYLAAPERASLLINIHDHEWELLKPGGRVFFVQGKIPNPPERLKTCSINWFNFLLDNISKI